MSKLEVGDKAPGFSLMDQNENKVSLSDFKGKKVLVFFYPRADTPGCTKQACSIRDSAAALAEASVTALGVSPDEPASQKKFDDKYELGFRLLSDPEHRCAEDYGVWREKNMYGNKKMGIERSTFLIDGKGVVRKVWRKVKVADHVEAVLDATKALKKSG